MNPQDYLNARRKTTNAAIYLTCGFCTIIVCCIFWLLLYYVARRKTSIPAVTPYTARTRDQQPPSHLVRPNPESGPVGAASGPITGPGQAVQSVTAPAPPPIPPTQAKPADLELKNYINRITTYLDQYKELNDEYYKCLAHKVPPTTNFKRLKELTNNLFVHIPTKTPAAFDKDQQTSIEYCLRNLNRISEFDGLVLDALSKSDPYDEYTDRERFEKSEELKKDAIRLLVKRKNFISEIERNLNEVKR